jgi:polyphosphate kinase
MIELLYAASQAGVKVDLIVRGICCLRPGVKGISDNIRVISIVGRFLEHSRVFWFAHDGHPELLLSSADMMGRNLNRRVELMFPVEDPALIARVKQETLEGALADRVRARQLGPDGLYTRVAPGHGADVIDSQTDLIRSRSQQHRPIHIVPREAP